MKLFTLFIYTLCITVCVNVYANESKEQNDEAQGRLASVQQTSAQAVEANKRSANDVVKERLHQHDVLKTQFLGKRPYMENKAK